MRARFRFPVIVATTWYAVSCLALSQAQEIFPPSDGPQLIPELAVTEVPFAELIEMLRKADPSFQAVVAYPPDSDRSGPIIQELKLKNVSLKHGDGSHDLKEELAVDAIVVSAGATHVPTPLLRYLKPGGRMVLPLAQPGDERGVQRLTVLELSGAGIKEQTLDAVRFVPLLAGLA